jgi:hypothetical protein
VDLQGIMIGIAVLLVFGIWASGQSALQNKAEDAR